MRRNPLPVAIIALLALGGCAITTPLTAPGGRIVSGGVNEVTIRTWGWTRPDEIARKYCRSHGKRAVYEIEWRTGGEYSDKRLHIYRCAE